MTGTLITPRTRDAIRQALLARFYGAIIPFAEAGHAGDIAVESPDQAYLEADALGVILAAAEKRAGGGLAAILPDRAIADSLRHHASIFELAHGDFELDHDFALRILAERQLRLGAGDPAEWIAWAKQVAGVSDAYWYSLTPPSSSTYGTLGTGSLLAMGPPQGSSVSDTRILTNPGALATLSGYLDGTLDANGNSVSGRQLRPTSTLLSIGPGNNVGIETCQISIQNVSFSVQNSPAFEFPWTPYNGVGVVGSTLTTVTVAGDYHTLAGLPMLLNVGTANARGGYVKATPSTGVFGGVNTVFTFATALPAPPSTAIYPAPANWPDLLAAVFSVFDALGPGDTATPSRFPPPDIYGEATFRLTHLIKAIMSVRGVLNCTMVSPLSNQTPAAKTLLKLGAVTITRS